MFNGKEILAIIPARSGCKSIPKKNIKLLGDKPLIAYTIEEALKSEYIDRTVVSTDDKEIAKIAKNYGAEVPFLRPRSLAEDTSSSLSVMGTTSTHNVLSNNVFVSSYCSVPA